VPDNISGKIINGYRFKADEMKGYRMTDFFFKQSEDLMQLAAPSKRNFLFKEMYLNL